MRLLVVFAFALLLLSQLASADCCVGAGSCQASLPGGVCLPGQSLRTQDCTALAECNTGCCCPSAGSSGTVTRNISCSAPSYFQPGAGVIGDTCSCAATTYSISGAVTLSGTFVSNALVSTGAVSTTTSSSGSYTLNSVPAGSVTLRASSQGCIGSTTLTLTSNRNNVNIPLSCSCTPGQCSSGSYCNSQRQWVEYDLSNSSRQAEYCGLCAGRDPICGADLCIDGDGTCNPSCSSAPSAGNYDSDCVCSPVRNNVCPSGCSPSTDGDCTQVQRGCGDGIVSYPFETCEQNPRNDQLSLCTGAQCVSCNCIASSTCGNRVIDSGEACELGMVCANGAACSNCQCNQACVAASKNPTITLSFSSSNRQTTVRWSTPDVCKSGVGSYGLFVCRVGGTACTDHADFELQGTYGSLQSNTSMVLDINQEFAFFVRAYYLDSSVGTSEIKKISSGSAFCMDLADTSSEFCWGNARSRCDANNNIVRVEDCNTGSRFCMGPDRSGSTVCESVGACDLCNGLYGSFSYLDWLQVPQSNVRKYCWPGTGRDVVSGCYEDNSKTVIDAFNYCGKVTSCYDFKSEDACEDPADPCRKNSGCEWVRLDDGKPELGGLCRPENANLQNCAFCDDSRYNSLSPECSPDVCALFGQCYYQGAAAPVSCSTRQLSSCQGYRSQSDCEGGRPVSVDAMYSNNTRIGGTHALTPSLDLLSLGKCRWDSTNSRCMRDADGLAPNFTTNTGFDCAERDSFCESDFGSPQTRILPSAFGLYPANARIRFVVEDDYPARVLTTYMCLSRGACYPTTASAQGEYLASVTQSGTYTLYYYSTDPAKNLEAVKRIDLEFDAELPVIDLLNFSNSTGFTNTPNLAVRTTSDARFVCANNTVTRQTSCVNSCSLANSSGCIPQSGLFTMSVPLGSISNLNATSGVIFYSEDFAGNRYQNTMLGIILDIEPPSAPVIYID